MSAFGIPVALIQSACRGLLRFHSREAERCAKCLSSSVSPANPKPPLTTLSESLRSAPHSSAHAIKRPHRRKHTGSHFCACAPHRFPRLISMEKFVVRSATANSRLCQWVRENFGDTASPSDVLTVRGSDEFDSMLLCRGPGSEQGTFSPTEFSSSRFTVTTDGELL